MADSHYTQSSHPDVARQHPYPPPGNQTTDPRAPRTDAMSAAASGTLPPQDPSTHGKDSPVPDPGPQGRPGYYAPSAFTATSPGDNLPHGEGHHKGFSERVHQLGSKAAEPINALANKVGSRAFLPSSMDKECQKAAETLLSFCEEGAAGEGHRPVSPGTRRPSRSRALLKLPQKVLRKAVGLAIFTAARAGFQFSASTGSGILIARQADGSWGAPSGIQVHALGAGFLAGADIYDCVCVINTKEALEAFSRTRVSLGPEVALAAGPFGAGGNLQVGAPVRSPEPEAASGAGGTGGQERLSAQRPDTKRRSSYKAYKPVFTYVKSRGLFGGVHIDGTVITERKEANADFYGARVSVPQILSGQNLPAREAPHLWPLAAKPLHDALRKAESRPEETEELIPPAEATPGIDGGPAPDYGDEDPPIQGGQNPVPRAGGESRGSVSGAGAHKTTDELPSYEGVGGTIRGQAFPEPGQKMGDEVPKEGQEKRGTVSGMGAHGTSDELPAYPGGNAPVESGKRSGGDSGGGVSGAGAHKTTDELGSYEGVGGTTQGQAFPEPGQKMGDEVPREGQERTGTVSGEGAHGTGDELPAYHGGKAPVEPEKRPT